ncbi:hypothetical protein RZA67_00715 [Stenotrophomonas sp. C3(2023)]|uniref:hypothetical protein n=1 Tax=Stenotrophomonas sp. C3(2023) TaxID=3080277 RepID=UPI00293C6A43|nr:hypothetical protein [Stenotrophomonas sp. C3(2023)]MDV3467259.1 hypothetical protein [Stenotrophomonas sp. C3(2023)]
MSPVAYVAFQSIAGTAVQNAEIINKVWLAGAAVIVSFLAILCGTVTQIFIASRLRRTQLELSRQRALQQQQSLSEQLSMQELASRRIAMANVSAKRQVWIDELRADIAQYVTLWQEISYRWEAIVSRAQLTDLSDEESDREFDKFRNDYAELRKEALQLALRIELRLNMTEQKHQQLNALMTRLERVVGGFDRVKSARQPSDVQNEFAAVRTQLVAKCQEILKVEWDRLKEESYVDPSR